MIVQKPHSQLSLEDRKKAARIYQKSRWAAWVVLVILFIAIATSIHVSFPNWPERIHKITFGFCFVLMIPVGEKFALERLCKAGLKRFISESRVLIGRARLEFAQDVSSPSTFVKYAPLLIFPLLWAIIFYVLQLTIFDIQNSYDRKDCIIATTFVAAVICLVANYLFPNSLFVRFWTQTLSDMWGTNASDYLNDIPWSRVAKVKEERIWKPDGKLTPHFFVFLDDKESVLKRVLVVPTRSEEIFQQIKTYLDNPRLEIES